MTDITFYTLTDTAPQAQVSFVAKLIASKLYPTHRVWVRAPQAVCERLSGLLWTASGDTRFIAHAMADAPEALHSSIVLASIEASLTPSGEWHGVLINMGDVVPEYFSQFERCVEMVAGDETNKVLGRERFRFYKERGYTITHHKI